MNLTTFTLGIMLGLFLYVGGYHAYGIIAFFLFFAVSLAAKTGGKSSSGSKMLEPIIVESPALKWGEGTKQMPTKIYKSEETLGWPAGEQKVWRKPLSKGLFGAIGKTIGGLLKDEE